MLVSIIAPEVGSDKGTGRAPSIVTASYRYWHGLIHMDGVSRELATARPTLVAVAGFADARTGKNVRPAIAQIMELTGESRATVKRRLRVGERLGWLTVDSRGTNVNGVNQASVWHLTAPTGDLLDGLVPVQDRRAHGSVPGVPGTIRGQATGCQVLLSPVPEASQQGCRCHR